MNTAAKQLGYYTIEDIYNLPDGQRAELIDGGVWQNPSKTCTFFDWTIGNYIYGKNGDCEVYPAPFAVFQNAGNEILQ